jgi:hypothetical protein
MTEKRKPPNAGKGRVKGVPNKATADVRMAIAKVAQNKSADLERWLDQTANGVKRLDKDGKETDSYLVDPDPGRAATVLLTALEFHIPKLARTEITGKDGAPVTMQVGPTDQNL